MSEPQAYREMSASERAPWDRWLKTALAAERQKIFDEIAEGVGVANEQMRVEIEAAYHAMHDEIDALKKEVATLTASRKSWWR